MCMIFDWLNRVSWWTHNEPSQRFHCLSGILCFFLRYEITNRNVTHLSISDENVPPEDLTTTWWHFIAASRLISLREFVSSDPHGPCGALICHWDDTEEPRGPRKLQVPCVSGCCEVIAVTLFGRYIILKNNLSWHDSCWSGCCLSWRRVRQQNLVSWATAYP